MRYFRSKKTTTGEKAQTKDDMIDVFAADMFVLSLLVQVHDSMANLHVSTRRMPLI